ncbi:MAG TPA: SgcJ/EcaC family oxidoreductase [Pyrinomonadaceae bacterium]|nr:SgcJ/EcaC family oxidoreductase [Pyrinomonadaceae bacterium]
MQSNEQAIRELIANWLSASKAGDTEKVLSLMSDDVIFLVCGQPPMRGKTAFATGQAALKDFNIEATSEIQEVKVLGDWAYVWTHLSIAITPKSGGAQVRRAGNTLSILRKQDDVWLLVRDANMLAPVA